MARTGTSTDSTAHASPPPAAAPARLVVAATCVTLRRAMSTAPQTASSALMPQRQAWVMLLALAGAFTLSQSFRTVAAIMGPPLASQLHLSPQQLGLWAAAYHFAFGAMQLECGETPISLSVFPLFFIASPMVRPGASITGIVRSLARERQFATVAEQSLISAITKYRNTSLPLQTHIFRALSPMPVTTIRPGMRRRSCANAACLLLTSAQ